jgi:hypothetical protein
VDIRAKKQTIGKDARLLPPVWNDVRSLKRIDHITLGNRASPIGSNEISPKLALAEPPDDSRLDPPSRILDVVGIKFSFDNMARMVLNCALFRKSFNDEISMLPIL